MSLSQLYQQPTSTPPYDQPATIDRASGEITPELIRQLTDKVYSLMLQDLKTEFERNRALRRNRR